MKLLEIRKAVGKTLAHDITRIIPGEYKGPRFKRGHIIKEEDIPLMLSMGKKYVYIRENTSNGIHEDEAAIRIAKASAGRGISFTGPGEGKMEFIAEYDGLLKIDVDQLNRLIAPDEIMFATIHTDQVVKKGQKLAGTRIIPLSAEDKIISDAENILKTGPLMKVLPLKRMRIGAVITGSEVYEGVIEDSFGPVLARKFTELGSHVYKQVISDDDESMIVRHIRQLYSEGAEMICVTGGMSVDPDDVTPKAIETAGADIISYGACVLPGAMFLLAYIGDVPVIGLPGCMIYSERTIFDIVVPRLLAGEKLSKKDIKSLAHGGYCRNCKLCTFPACEFGK